MQDSLKVGNRKQLFIDDKFVDKSEEIFFKVNPPEKQEIVLKGEQPWEVTGAYFTVVQDNGAVKIFYTTHTHGDNTLFSYFCYAVSEDGIHFEKPNLNMFEMDGSKNNNILFKCAWNDTVIYDNKPGIDPEERYKMLYFYGWPFYPREVDDMNVCGICLMTSPDGIHWKKQPERLAAYNIDSPLPAFWDDRINKYVIYPRCWKYNTQPNRRQIARIETDDITKPWPNKENAPYWPYWERILKAEPGTKGSQCYHDQAIEPVIVSDELDEKDMDFYLNSAIKYPYAEDAYFMFPAAYKHRPAPYDGNEGPICTQLAASRDGIHWNRYDRMPYIRPGLNDEFDRGYNIMGIGFARFGNYIYQYCTVKGGTHHQTKDDLPYSEFKKIERNCYVRLKQRLDGFVSLDVPYTGGWFISHPMSFKGTQLELNIDTEATGHTRVEIQEADGTPVPGFTLEDCDEIWGNYIDRKVTWKGNADLSCLAGRPIRLHFKMRSTKLFAFQFK